MASYRLTRKADNDLAALYEYGILNFGLGKAKSYLIGMYERFDQLAGQPDIGRSADELLPGMTRLEYGSHVIFYMAHPDGSVLIVRVLRKEMDFKRHL